MVCRYCSISCIEMYNCTKHNTGSAVARVTKDRATRPHLSSTVENQLGRRIRRRQLLTIAQWNVRTLLDREAADRPERCTAQVVMESHRLGILFLLEWQTRRRKKGGLSGLCYQKGYRHNADRNVTACK